MLRSYLPIASKRSAKATKLIEDNCPLQLNLTSTSPRGTERRSAIFHWQVASQTISTIKQIDFSLPPLDDLAKWREARRSEIFMCLHMRWFRWMEQPGGNWISLGREKVNGQRDFLLWTASLRCAKFMTMPVFDGCVQWREIMLFFQASSLLMPHIDSADRARDFLFSCLFVSLSQSWKFLSQNGRSKRRRRRKEKFLTITQLKT